VACFIIKHATAPLIFENAHFQKKKKKNTTTTKKQQQILKKKKKNAHSLE